MTEMPLPLYQGFDAPGRRPQDAHPGLWFDRYFSAYEPDFRKVDKAAQTKDEDSPSKQWLSGFDGPMGDRSQLQAAALRALQRVHNFGGAARVLHCTGRFVSGIGNAHPVENGFSWHPTLGVPYLPGSGVKGLVRAALEVGLDASEAERHELLRRWFGTAVKGDVAEQAGAFVFLDALPVAPCAIKLEVLAPHMGKWYEKGGKSPLRPDTMPGDWHSPVPIFWLAASDLQLQFAVMPRPGATAESLDELWQALEYALDTMGAGAKTAIGFGQFHATTKAQQTQEMLHQAMQSAAAADAQQQREKAMETASDEQRSVLALETFLEAIPGKLSPSDALNGQLWALIAKAVELVGDSGSEAEKKRLCQMLLDARDTRFTVSKKKEKEFKAWLAQVR